MEFRVMDEAAFFEGHGVALLVSEGDCEALTDGCRIRDIRGREHVVERVSRQEELTVLFLRGANAAYFGRLFRDVLVDATLFTLMQEEG